MENSTWPRKKCIFEPTLHPRGGFFFVLIVLGCCSFVCIGCIFPRSLYPGLQSSANGAWITFLPHFQDVAPTGRRSNCARIKNLPPLKNSEQKKKKKKKEKKESRVGSQQRKSPHLPNTHEFAQQNASTYARRCFIHFFFSFCLTCDF